MALAVFDYSTWALLYPQLAVTVAEPQAQALFNRAGRVYLNNSDQSPICDVDTRLDLLNMLVAHTAILSARSTSDGIVGRVSSASEGTVSVSSEYKGPDDASWFLQTPPGADYWQATAPYRLGRYYAPPEPYLGVGNGTYGGSYGFPGPHGWQ